MRKSILDSSNTVVNVIVLNEDSIWNPPAGQTIGPDGGEIGNIWTGTEYQRPIVDMPVIENEIIEANTSEPVIL